MNKSLKMHVHTMFLLVAINCMSQSSSIVELSFSDLNMDVRSCDTWSYTGWGILTNQSPSADEDCYMKLKALKKRSQMVLMLCQTRFVLDPEDGKHSDNRYLLPLLPQLPQWCHKPQNTSDEFCHVLSLHDPMTQVGVDCWQVIFCADILCK